jgi:acyl-coenzyme A thioesterase PaaI-like protein
MTQSAQPGRPDVLGAKPQSRCFACGAENPHGLHLQFGPDTDGAVAAEWTPLSHFEGFQGIVHGGVISTVLDEAMSKAVAARGWQALTCDLRVRLRVHVEVGSRMMVRAWVVEKNRRRVLTEASLTDDTGAECAHGWATFLELRRA